MLTKLDKIRADLNKARTKRDEWEQRVKDLEKKYKETENTMIHDMVHAANITPNSWQSLFKKQIPLFLLKLRRILKMTIKRRIVLPILMVVMAMGLLVPTTAYAKASEQPPAEITEEKKEEPKPEKPLTPDGNLTLVDDVGAESSVGKQFVTLVSKNGNYFYLIIDRDDKGNSTVHFLNQVDEIDLMSLMEKEDAEKLQAELNQKDEPKVEETQPGEKVEVIEEHEPEKPINLLLIVVLVIVMIGGGVFAFMKLKEKKKAEETKPDPDADYSDDEVDDEDDELEYFEIDDEAEETEEKA